jgi:hypothetical protein
MKLRRVLKLKLRASFGPMPRPEKWVFIVGCTNSGTSLLHQLLAHHPAVGSLPREGQFATDQLVPPTRLGFARLWGLDLERFHLTESDGGSIDVNALKRQWGSEFNDVRRPVLIEKSPPNGVRTRWLQANFKNAHFIGLVRNGYAVSEGIARKIGCPMDLAALQWARTNEVMLDDWEHLAKRTLVRYEELAADPRGVLRRLFEFLDLEPDSFDWSSLTEQPMRIHERFEVIADMNQASFRAMNDDQLLIIEREAGRMLQTLGYSRP